MSTVETTSRPTRPPLPAEYQAVHLYGLLQGASRLALALSAAALCGWSVAALVLLVLVAVLADAVFAFPAAVRMAIDGGLLAAAGLVLLRLLRDGLRNRFDARRAARLVECRLDLRDNVLINAVEFAESRPRHDSPQLRQRVVQMAEERARNISALDILSWRPLARALAAAGLALLVAGILWLAVPQLFAMVSPRYLDPSGDHPPFTLVTFAVRIEPDPVYHGRPATIRADLGGPEEIDQATVVFLDDANPDNVESAPMFHREAGTFELSLAHPDRSRRFYIDTPRGRSATYQLVVEEIPFFEEVTVRYESPQYTGWPAQEQRLEARGLRGLVGTVAVITARSHLPLASGRLDLFPSPAHPGAVGAATSPARSERTTATSIRLTPDPKDPRSVTGRVVLRQNGQFSLSLQGASGGESLEPLTGPVQVTADRPPRVAILEPAPHVMVVENWKVRITVEAADDVAVSGLSLNRSVNGWGPSRLELPLQEDRAGVVRGEAWLDLADLGAQSGDIITCYATAQDNHPDPPQFADSETCVLQVISHEEYLQFARQQHQIDDLLAEVAAVRSQLEQLEKQRQTAVDELDELRQRLAAQPDDPELTEALQQAEADLQKLARQTSSLAEKLQQRAEQSRLYEVEEPLQQLLKRTAEELRQQAERETAAADALRQLREAGNSPERREALETALDALRPPQPDSGDNSQQQLAEAEQDLELYRLADELLATAERLRSVIQQQRDLATRLAEFQDRASLTSSQQQRADQLAREQELLEQELQEIRRQLAQTAETSQERLPKMSASAQKIAEQIGSEKIPEDQQQAADQARRGSGRTAHQRAAAAADKLEALAGEPPTPGQCAGEMCSGLDGPLSLSPGSVEQTLRQLSQGRNIPGPPRPGQGNGQGQRSGGSGSGMTGTGGQPQGGAGQFPSDWRPGQSFPGSQARLPILGPQVMSQEHPPQSGSQFGSNERSLLAPIQSGEPLGDAESLTPQSRLQRSSAIGTLRGVPIPYRKEAEAYFRRLAEDAAAGEK